MSESPLDITELKMHTEQRPEPGPHVLEGRYPHRGCLRRLRRIVCVRSSKAWNFLWNLV
jgi:hypothetical protein